MRDSEQSPNPQLCNLTTALSVYAPHSQVLLNPTNGELIQLAADLITAHSALPRPFHLERDTDETGVSGTGKVAEGVVFRSGKVAIAWLTDVSSVAVYDSIADAEAIHGHGGLTRFVFP